MGIFEDKDIWVHDEYPDVCFRWFANHRTLLDFMITKKKYKVVVAGGYDTSDIKGYGMLSNPILKYIAKSVFNKVDLIIASSELIEKELIDLGIDENKIKIVYPSVSNVFYENNYDKSVKFYDYITICNSNKRSWKVKGIDDFVNKAKEEPNKLFLLIGNNYLDECILSKNIVTKSKTDNNELITYMNQSKCYLCPSRRESFGVAPIEAKIFGMDIEFLNDIHTKDQLGYHSSLNYCRLKERVRKLDIRNALDKLTGREYFERKSE